MSQILDTFPQLLLNSTKKILDEQLPKDLLNSTAKQCLETGFESIPLVSKQLMDQINAVTAPELAEASLFMGQATLIGYSLANSLKHLVGLGDSKDLAGRETFSLGDTVSSLVLGSLTTEFFPEYGILDEESGGIRLEKQKIFTIDPIDGSISFTHCVDEAWAVGMALYDKTVVSANNSGIVASAIALPQQEIKQQLVLGVVSSGCWDLAGEPQKVSLPSYVQNDVRRCVVSIGHKDMRSHIWDRGLQTLAEQAQRLYAGIDIQHAGALAARGQIDVLIRSKQLPYDLAPIIGVVEAAGGKVLTFDQKIPKIPLDLTTEQHVVAWNGDKKLGDYLFELVNTP